MPWSLFFPWEKHVVSCTVHGSNNFFDRYDLSALVCEDTAGIKSATPQQTTSLQISPECAWAIT